MVAAPANLESEKEMHPIAQRIIRDQIKYYDTKHWLAKTDEDKEKYANLIIAWAAKLEDSGD